MKIFYNKEEAKKIFFTSDTHFNHTNIIKFCKRPFNSAAEQDEELIRRWNEKVDEDGIVFHLGDVGFGNKETISKILHRLNGKIYLIIGNHDWKNIINKHDDRFEDITQQANIKIDTQKIILNHYPFLCYSGTYNREIPTWQLFGHVHTSPYGYSGLDTPRMQMLFPYQYDVGVDNNDFRPVSYEEVKKIIEDKLKNN